MVSDHDVITERIDKATVKLFPNEVESGNQGITCGIGAKSQQMAYFGAGQITYLAFDKISRESGKGFLIMSEELTRKQSRFFGKAEVPVTDRLFPQRRLSHRSR